MPKCYHKKASRRVSGRTTRRVSRKAAKRVARNTAQGTVRFRNLKGLLVDANFDGLNITGTAGAAPAR